MARSNQRFLMHGVQWAGAALLTVLVCAGCGKRKPEPVPPPPIAPQPSKTALQERMDSPEYLQTLKDFQAERQAKAAEAAQIRDQMTALVRKAEQDNPAAVLIRQEIDALRTQIAEKEVALVELARQDPAWHKLEEDYRTIEVELNAIRERAQATVQGKMKDQAAERLAASAQAGTRRSPVPQPPAIHRMTNEAPFAVIAVTNAATVVAPAEAQASKEAL